MVRGRATVLGGSVLLLLIVAAGGWYWWDGRQLARDLARWRDPDISPHAIDHMLPALGESRRTARGLAGIAREAAAAGDWVVVDMALLDMLAIADEQQRKRLLTAQLVAASVRALALQTIADVYAQPEAPSAKLIEAVAAIDQGAAIRDAVPAERAFVVSRWDAGAAHRRLVRAALAESDAFEEAAQAGDEGLRAYVAAAPASGWLAASRTALQLQARAEMAELAMRLRVYRAEHGAYPVRLEELGDVPVNPLTGGEIAYRLLGQGFELRADGQRTEELAVWAWDVPEQAEAD